MNKQERIQECMEVERYLQNKNVYEIMQDLVEELLISQPSDPLGHMINHLSKPSSSLTVLVGPPGLRLYKIASQALSQESNTQYAAFNSGNFIESSKASLPAQAQQIFKQQRLISDELIAQKLVPEIVNFTKANNFSIIQGFPKTLKQGITLHNKGLIPDKVIFVNIDKDNLEELCYQKMKSLNPDLPRRQLIQKSIECLNQYQINIRDLKAFYPSYLEIDASEGKFIAQQIKKCLNLDVGKIQPRKNTKIVILGAPMSGRTTLGKKIAQKYNLIYVSSAVLISQQIRRDTVVGRKIKDKYLSHQMIDNFTIQKLIEQRICKIDCQMQGYVLEGYPKSREQYDNLKNLHIVADFVIGMHSNESIIRSRAGKNVGAEDLNRRLEKWKQFSASLTDVKQIFWIHPSFSVDNTFQSVCFEIQNHKN